MSALPCIPHAQQGHALKLFLGRYGWHSGGLLLNLMDLLPSINVVSQSANQLVLSFASLQHYY